MFFNLINTNKLPGISNVQYKVLSFTDGILKSDYFHLSSRKVNNRKLNYLSNHCKTKTIYLSLQCASCFLSPSIGIN